MNIVVSFLTGLVFGLGLIIAGMANPAKVLGFLDLAGKWDPSLALVMAGAIALSAPAYAAMRGRRTALLGAALQIPSLRHLDRRLIGGSLLFGIGWGLAGICPGPAVVLLGAGLPAGVVFVAAMLAGMAAFEWLDRRRSAAPSALSGSAADA